MVTETTLYQKNLYCYKYFLFYSQFSFVLFKILKFDTFRVGPQLKKEKNYLRRLFECEQIQISLYLQNKPKILFWWRNFNKQYNVPNVKIKKKYLKQSEIHGITMADLDIK